MNQGVYPADWPEITKRVKEKAGWRCERCGVPHGPVPNVLTTHHLDGDKSNVEDWNLAALCQRCHLHIQGRVNMFQDWLLPHSAWMRSHVEGRDRAIAEGRWPRW